MEMLCTILRANALNGFDREALLAQPDLWRKLANRLDKREARWPVPLKSGGTAVVCFVVVRPTSPEDAFEFVRQSVDKGQGVIADTEKTLIFCGYEADGDVRKRRVFWITGEPIARGWWTWEEFEEHCQRDTRSELMARFSGVTLPV